MTSKVEPRRLKSDCYQTYPLPRRNGKTLETHTSGVPNLYGTRQDWPRKLLTHTISDTSSSSSDDLESGYTIEIIQWPPRAGSRSLCFEKH